jgi:hypothetical protein
MTEEAKGERAVDYDKLDELAAAGVDVGVVAGDDPGLVCPGDGGQPDHDWQQVDDEDGVVTYTCGRIGCGATTKAEREPLPDHGADSSLLRDADDDPLRRPLADDEVLVVRAAVIEGRLCIVSRTGVDGQLRGGAVEIDDRGLRTATDVLDRYLRALGADWGRWPRSDEIHDRLSAIAGAEAS